MSTTTSEGKGRKRKAKFADVVSIAAELQRRLNPEGRNQRDGGYMDNLPPVECADGVTMSVQSGPSHYCSPRNGDGPWLKVEVGFPSVKIPSFMEYIDGTDSEPTQTVYGYVPLDVVAAAIKKHGGLL